MPVLGFAAKLAKGAIKGTPFGGVASALADEVLNTSSKSNEDKPKRHRRKSLTKGQMADIIFLAGNVSHKAAENYLTLHQ